MVSLDYMSCNVGIQSRSTPSHAPLKYMCLIKTSNQISAHTLPRGGVMEIDLELRN